MLLLIDTSKFNSTVVLGNKQGEIIDIEKNITKLKLSQTLLSEINLLLRRNKVSFGNLKGIIVVQGPGSFTGLRVGISVANSLGYGLEIPVVGVKKFKVKSSKLKVQGSELKVQGLKLKVRPEKSFPKKLRHGASHSYEPRSQKSKMYYRNIFRRGLKKLRYAKPGKIVKPFYGEEPHVTVRE